MVFLVLQSSCFTFIVFLLSYGSLYSVFLPRGIVVWSEAGSVILACPRHTHLYVNKTFNNHLNHF